MGVIRIGTGRAGGAAPQQGWAGRIGAAVFGLVFVGFGGVFLFLVGRELWLASQTRWWTQVPCTITESRVATNDKTDRAKPYRPIVRYRYSAADGLRSSDAIALKNPAYDSYAKAQAVVDRYPVNSTTTCFVDPKSPGRSALEHGSLWVGLFAPIPLVIVVFGLAVVWAALRGTGVSGGGGGGGGAGATSSTEPAPAGLPVAISEKARKGAFVAPLLFGIFLLVGLGVSIPIVILPVRRILAARDWPAVPCTIVHARVQQHRDSDGDYTYSPDILYRYTVAGREHQSNRYSAQSISTGSRSGPDAAVAHYRPRGKATCYVNPADPDDAMLDRDWSGSMFLIGLVPLVFTLVGAGGLYFTIRSARRRGLIGRPGGSLSPIQPISGAAAYRPGAATRATISSPRPDYHAGPVTLRSRQGPAAKLIVATAIAVFWNGIVSVFLLDTLRTYHGGRGGHVDVCGTVFLIPFVLVGLAFIVWVGYSILALFNPRPELTLDRSAIPLGGTAHLAWTFSGRCDRISRLRVTLEGREEATYRRGTNTATDRRAFFRETLADATRPVEISSGRATLTIPADTMHSFSAPNNKIVWELKFHGDIAGWPDVDECFALEILPVGA